MALPLPPVTNCGRRTESFGDRKRREELEILAGDESQLAIVSLERGGHAIFARQRVDAVVFVGKQSVTFFNNQFVVEYKGELITGKEAELREATYKFNNYGWGKFTYFFKHNSHLFA